MNRIIFLLLLVLISSCAQEEKDYNIVMIESELVNDGFVSEIDETGRMLLGGYLYAYGNECTDGSDKNKCTLLDILHVSDECDPKYINRLKQWFAKDPIMIYKLNNCPVMPFNSAMSNTFDELSIIRKSDTISIKYYIKGFNNSEEKGWNVDRQDTYVITNNTFIKI